MTNAQSSPLYFFLAKVDFTHILQEYFTGTGAVVRLPPGDCPDASEATLKDMGIHIIWNITKWW